MTATPTSPKRSSPTGLQFYATSGFAGAVAASITHVILVPADVIKTRIQIDKIKYPSFGSAFRTLVKEEGMSSLALGLSPTLVGYCSQGFLKYGLYEYFKKTFKELAGQETAERFATGLYLAAGTSAEMIADLALTPFEAVRIRMVAQPTWATGLVDGLAKLHAVEGLQGLYKGLTPLMMKQVPYTAVKFAVFEASEDVLYGMIPAEKSMHLTKFEQLGITTVAGFIAGVASAVASHPADTLLTKLNMRKSSGSTASAIIGAIKETGFRGIWTGVLPRMGMVGFMASLQLLAYDATKVLCGLPVSQGVKARHGHAPASASASGGH